jgi:hypothetical protein
MDSNISHSKECIICILILCDISTLIVPLFTLQLYIQFFCKGSYFNLNAKPANPSLALCHNLKNLPPTRINSSRHHLISLSACPASKQELLSSWKRKVPWLWQVVRSDWTTPDVPQSLSGSDSGTCLPAETCRMPQPQQLHGPLNRNNSCSFHPWGWQWYVYCHVYQRRQEATTHWARRGHKSNVTFEGIDIVDAFGPITPCPSGDIDPMEVDLHSRGFISVVHNLEFPANSNHGRFTQ